MLRYSGYLLLTYLRKWTFLIIITSYILVFSVVTSLEIKSANNHILSNASKFSFLDNVSIFDSIIPFAFGCVYVGFAVIFLFNESQSTGTELLIMSKPIKRWEILSAKLFTLIAYILFFIFISFVLSYLISLQDIYSGQAARIEYAGSLAVGGLVVMLVLSSIISLLAMFVNGVTVVIFSTSLSVILPGLSFAMINLTDATGKKFDLLEMNSAIQNYDDSGQIYYDKDYIFRGTTLNYLDTNGDGVLSNTELINHPEYKNIDENKSAYSKLVYIDVFSQWNNFFNMFRDESMNGKDVVADWKIKYTTYTSNEDLVSFDDGNGEVVNYVFQGDPFYRMGKYNNSGNDYDVYYGKVSEFAKNSWVNNLSFDSRLHDIINLNINNLNVNYYWVYMNIMNDNPSIPLPVLENGMPAQNSVVLMEVSHTDNGKTIYNKIISLSPDEWASMDYCVVIWLITTILCFMCVVLRFYKKDFK